MPAYQYKCEPCGATFAFTQDPQNPVRPKCPKCQSEKTRRVFSTPGARPAYVQPPPPPGGGG